MVDSYMPTVPGLEEEEEAQAPANPFAAYGPGYVPQSPQQYMASLNSGSPNSSWWGSGSATPVDQNQLNNITSNWNAYQNYQNQSNAFNQQQMANNPTQMPQNPYQALQYQWAAGQNDRQLQLQTIQQALAAYGAAGQQASSAWQQSQARNESTMREGLGDARAETQASRENNAQRMMQRQAVLQHRMGLLRKGGAGSLADVTSSMASELGSTYQMGMYGPQDYGSYYQGMMGTPDPSSQYTAQMGNMLGGVQFQPQDHSAWAEPESMRTEGWYLPSPTAFSSTQTQQPYSPLFNQNTNPQGSMDALWQYLMGSGGGQGGED
jgi:hypothetical protein